MQAPTTFGADDEITLGVDRPAGSDHRFPPAGLAGNRMDIGDVLIAGQRMADQDGVRALGIERTIGLVGDLERREIDARVELRSGSSGPKRTSGECGWSASRVRSERFTMFVSTMCCLRCRSLTTVSPRPATGGLGRVRLPNRQRFLCLRRPCPVINAAALRAPQRAPLPSWLINPVLPTLPELRAEIDRIDETMHGLLMQRGDIIDRLISVKRTEESRLRLPSGARGRNDAPAGAAPSRHPSA